MFICAHFYRFPKKSQYFFFFFVLLVSAFVAPRTLPSCCSSRFAARLAFGSTMGPRQILKSVRMALVQMCVLYFVLINHNCTISIRLISPFSTDAPPRAPRAHRSVYVHRHVSFTGCCLWRFCSLGQRRHDLSHSNRRLHWRPSF